MLQSMERHLAGVGGDGDGALEAKGDSGDPSMEGIDIFCAGGGSLCSGVRSALGEPNALMCSEDIGSSTTSHACYTRSTAATH
jgi:hypothetical protein